MQQWYTFYYVLFVLLIYDDGKLYLYGTFDTRSALQQRNDMHQGLQIKKEDINEYQNKDKII